MPFYRIYHPEGAFSDEDKAIIAKGFTKIHGETTSTTPISIKVAFIPLSPSNVFSGGVPESRLVRVVGLIRGGRTADVKASLLRDYEALLKPYVEKLNGITEITFVENGPEDNVRYAAEGSSSEDKAWAALSPSQKL